MAVEYDYIVCRYGELVLKGKNRHNFVNLLVGNIKTALKSFPALVYLKQHDGLFIALNGSDYAAVSERLKKVFGLSYFAGAIRAKKELADIKAKALAVALRTPGKTFKVIAKRNDKTFPLISDTINREVAALILAETSLKVDVHNPDIRLMITIKSDAAYVMDHKEVTYGGYPVGVNGKALVLTSGGIDSPVAAFLTMKRGLRIECLHFASEPYTSPQALLKVYDLAKQLAVYQNEIFVHVVPFTALQLAVYKHSAESYAITLLRRMMYRIADRFAKERDIKVITTGESLGQVASQTAESLTVIAAVAETLVLRPLCMLDKQEIISLAKQIGTYETSILPYEDCCTLFAPKNPVTRPKAERAAFYESRFDYESLLNECLQGIKTFRFKADAEEDAEIY